MQGLQNRVIFKVQRSVYLNPTKKRQTLLVRPQVRAKENLSLLELLSAVLAAMVRIRAKSSAPLEPRGNGKRRMERRGHACITNFVSCSIAGWDGIHYSLALLEKAIIREAAGLTKDGTSVSS